MTFNPSQTKPKMTTKTTTHLTSIVLARVDEYAVDPSLANIRLTFVQQSFGEEGVFYPAQDITIYGDGINKLRTLLDTLPAK